MPGMIADRRAAWTTVCGDLAPGGRIRTGSSMGRCWCAVPRFDARRKAAAMKSRPRLKLETTGQFLSIPLVGAHDNSEPIKIAVDRSVAQLARLSGP
jgi:hypothetical protein